jgi:hypothetical protein
MIEIRFDKTKDEVALLIWFLVDHSVYYMYVVYRVIQFGIRGPTSFLFLEKSIANDIQVSQKWRTNYLLPYRGCLNVHEKNMEKMFPSKKSIIFIIIINENRM